MTARGQGAINFHRIEHLRSLTEAGYLPVSEYVAARREWLAGELAATERRLQNLLLSPFDRWECEEYARDLKRELDGDKYVAPQG